MMLSEDQIKQGILHPERDVRDAIVFYFAKSFSPDPSLMPLVIQAIEQYGSAEAFQVYSFLNELSVQTDDAFCWLLNERKRVGVPQDEPEEDYALGLSAALTQAEPALLKLHHADLMAMDDLDHEARETIDERILYQDFGPEKLWNEFEDFIQAMDEAEAGSDEEIDHGNRLVAEMGRFRDAYADKVLAILRETTDESRTARQGFATRLSGELRLEAAVPLLLAMFNDDNDWLREETLRALTKIGTDSVIRELASRYPKEDLNFRLGVACLLEDIHSDRSVQTCLDLLKHEENQEIKGLLLQSILMNFADEGIEPARQFILQTPLDPNVLEVRSVLLTVCKLMGVHFPEFEVWKEDATHDMELRRKWHAEHGSPDDEYGEAEDEEDFEDEDEEDLPAVKPFIREQERIGRNDPCPCGSGKKFKKCCYGRPADAADALAGSEAVYRPRQSKPQFPVGTFALYGPDDKRTTKIVAGVIKREGAEPIIERWVGTNVKNDPKVQQKIKGFFDRHGVKSVAATDRNMGCPHEEGEDFPVGEDCPFCPFWKGKQGSNRRE